MTRQLAAVGNRAIAEYGERDAIKELGVRVKQFLPNGDKMTEGDARAFAQAALALDLNPFAGEIWYIPGVGIVTGIAGYRKIARQQGPFVAQCRQMSPDEREDHNLKDDDLGAICELYRPDQLRMSAELNQAAGKQIIPVGPTIGIGIWRAAELETRSGKHKAPPTARSWRWIAEKRAEADALRKGFDLTLAYAETGTQVVDGEILSDEPVQLSDWAIKALEEEAKPTPDDFARKQAILHGDEEDWDAQSFATRGQPVPSSSDAAIEADFPPEEIEAPPDEKGTWLPVTWPAYAAKACSLLGYANVRAVADVLRRNGMDRLSNASNVLQFDAVDGWSILKDNAPPKHLTLAL